MKEFIEKSTSHQEQQRRIGYLMRMLLGLGIVAALAICASCWAFWSASDKAKQAEKAIQLAAEALDDASPLPTSEESYLNLLQETYRSWKDLPDRDDPDSFHRKLLNRLLSEAGGTRLGRYGECGHVGRINKVQVLDGRIITIGSDNLVCSWSMDGWPNTRSLAKPRMLEGHGDAVIDFATSNDQRYLVTASVDRTAILWTLDDIESKGITLKFENRDEHRGVVTSVVFDPRSDLDPCDWLLTGDSSGYMYLWRLTKDGELDCDCVARFGADGQSGIQKIATDDDFTLLAAGRQDGEVRLWNLSAVLTELESGGTQEERTRKASDSDIPKPINVPLVDSEVLPVPGVPLLIKKWPNDLKALVTQWVRDIRARFGVDTELFLGSEIVSKGSLRDLEFCHCQSNPWWLVAAYDRGALDLYCINELAPNHGRSSETANIGGQEFYIAQRALQSHGSEVVDIGISANDRYLVTAEKRGLVVAWNLQKLLEDFDKSPQPLSRQEYGTELVQDPTEINIDVITDIATSGDENWIGIGTHLVDGAWGYDTAYLWRMASSDATVPFERPEKYRLKLPRSVMAITFSSPKFGATLFVTALNDGTARVWNLETIKHWHGKLRLEESVDMRKKALNLESAVEIDSLTSQVLDWSGRDSGQESHR
jgi:WD40 repeat protein